MESEIRHQKTAANQTERESRRERERVKIERVFYQGIGSHCEGREGRREGRASRETPGRALRPPALATAASSPEQLPLRRRRPSCFSLHFLSPKPKECDIIMSVYIYMCVYMKRKLKPKLWPILAKPIRKSHFL